MKKIYVRPQAAVVCDIPELCTIVNPGSYNSNNRAKDNDFGMDVWDEEEEYEEEYDEQAWNDVFALQ